MQYIDGKGFLIGQTLGHPMYMLGASYNCPTMRLYGYATDLQLIRAIQRKYRKATKRLESRAVEG